VFSTTVNKNYFNGTLQGALNSRSKNKVKLQVFMTLDDLSRIKTKKKFVLDFYQNGNYIYQEDVVV